MSEEELALLNNNLLVGALLFGIGIIGFLSRRNMILMFLSAELMLQGVSLSLIAWGRFYNDFGGQMLVFFIITVAACEAAIALAMVLMLFQRRGSLDIADLAGPPRGDLAPVCGPRAAGGKSGSAAVAAFAARRRGAGDFARRSWLSSPRLTDQRRFGGADVTMIIVTL